MLDTLLIIRLGSIATLLLGLASIVLSYLSIRTSKRIDRIEEILYEKGLNE